MPNVLVNDSHLSDIADAIRAKNGSSDTYKPSEMASAISAITTSSGSSSGSAGMQFKSVKSHPNIGIIIFTRLGPIVRKTLTNITNEVQL